METRKQNTYLLHWPLITDPSVYGSEDAVGHCLLRLAISNVVDGHRPKLMELHKPKAVVHPNVDAFVEIYVGPRVDSVAKLFHQKIERQDKVAKARGVYESANRHLTGLQEQRDNHYAAIPEVMRATEAVRAQKELIRAIRRSDRNARSTAHTQLTQLETALRSAKESSPSPVTPEQIREATTSKATALQLLEAARYEAGGVRFKRDWLRDYLADRFSGAVLPATLEAAVCKGDVSWCDVPVTDDRIRTTSLGVPLVDDTEGATDRLFRIPLDLIIEAFRLENYNRDVTKGAYFAFAPMRKERKISKHSLQNLVQGEGDLIVGELGTGRDGQPVGHIAVIPYRVLLQLVKDFDLLLERGIVAFHVEMHPHPSHATLETAEAPVAARATANGKHEAETAEAPAAVGASDTSETPAVTH